MLILPALATQFQSLFPASDSGQERWRWFMLTLQAILVPITASPTSNLLRTIAALFGVEMAQSRYYTFMASVKLHWEPVWEVLWGAIPAPLTAGRFLFGLDDSTCPKTGRKVFGCQTTFATPPRPTSAATHGRRRSSRWACSRSSRAAGAACPWRLRSICGA